MLKKLGLGILVFSFCFVVTNYASAALTFSNLAIDSAAGDAMTIGASNVAGTIAIGVANTGGITIGNGDTIKTISIGAGNAVNTIHIGDHATPVNVITIGGAASSLALTDADWSITTAGAATLGTLLHKDLTEVVAAANTITAAESGSVFFLSATAEFASTLPAPAAGLHYTFIVSAAPSGASYTIASASGTDNIHGTAVSSADAGGSMDSTAGTAADTITFVDGQSLKGDMVELWCDGTSWYASGFASDEDAITYTAS